MKNSYICVVGSENRIVFCDLGSPWLSLFVAYLVLRVFTYEIVHDCNQYEIRLWLINSVIQYHKIVHESILNWL